MLSGLSYGCDSVTVPPQPELSSVCQTVIQKCPGLISIEESDGGDWEEQEYEEITGITPSRKTTRNPSIGRPIRVKMTLRERRRERLRRGDEDFFGDDSDDEEDESWY